MPAPCLRGWVSTGNTPRTPCHFSPDERHKRIEIMICSTSPEAFSCSTRAPLPWQAVTLCGIYLREKQMVRTYPLHRLTPVRVWVDVEGLDRGLSFRHTSQDQRRGKPDFQRRRHHRGNRKRRHLDRELRDHRVSIFSRPLSTQWPVSCRFDAATPTITVDLGRSRLPR